MFFTQYRGRNTHTLADSLEKLRDIQIIFTTRNLSKLSTSETNLRDARAFYRLPISWKLNLCYLSTL